MCKLCPKPLRMFRLVLLCFLFLAGLLRAQEPLLQIDIPEGAKPWTSLDLNNEADNFQFIIVTDRTGGHRPGVFEDAVHKINLLQPEFVMSVGDLIEGYTDDVAQLDREWNEFTGFTDQLQMPFFYVPGNHDLTNAVQERVWEERFGPTYYHFVYRDVLFLCLNSEDQLRGAGRGTLSDEQFDYVQRVLAEHEEVRWTMLFMHQPLWLYEETERWREVEALLAERKHTVFVGHVHHYVKYERNNGRYYTLATTGGGSNLRGPQLGEFDHVTWVTMTEEGPIMANLALSGIWRDDVVTEKDYGFLTTLEARKPVRLIPPFTDAAEFAEGTLQLRLENPADIPVLVRIDPGFSFDLGVQLETDTLTLGPNSTLIQELPVTARKAAPVELLQSLPLRIDFQYKSEGGPEMTVPFAYQIAPQPRYYFAPAPANFELDGNLGEWDGLPYVFSGPDPADCGVRFQVARDEDYIYLAAQVLDDDVRLAPGTVAWQQDFLGFVLNGEMSSRSAMNRGDEWYLESLAFNITPGGPHVPSTTYYEDRPGFVGEYRCQIVAGGYAFEGRIPISYLNEKQGGNWESARLNFMVQDWDTDEEDKPRYFWQPDWRGNENQVGSGMFWR